MINILRNLLLIVFFYVVSGRIVCHNFSENDMFFCGYLSICVLYFMCEMNDTENLSNSEKNGV
ncbi:hypothetical protein GCM10020331_044940 [Ectobacillus funiculus]